MKDRVTFRKRSPIRRRSPIRNVRRIDRNVSGNGWRKRNIDNRMVQRRIRQRSPIRQQWKPRRRQEEQPVQYQQQPVAQQPHNCQGCCQRNTMVQSMPQPMIQPLPQPLPQPMPQMQACQYVLPGHPGLPEGYQMHQHQTMMPRYHY